MEKRAVRISWVPRPTQPAVVASFKTLPVEHVGSVDESLEVAMEARILVFIDLRAVVVGVGEGGGGGAVVTIHRQRASGKLGVNGGTILARPLAADIRKDDATWIQRTKSGKIIGMVCSLLLAGVLRAAHLRLWPFSICGSEGLHCTSCTATRAQQRSSGGHAIPRDKTG